MNLFLIDTANNVWASYNDESLAALQSNGVKRVISLFPAKDSDFLTTFPSDLGMDSYPMPVSGFFPPDDSATKKIITLVPDGKMTVIMGPPNQLAFVLAAYRMQLLSWAPESAFAEWNKVRSWWTFWWDSYLAEWER